MSGRVYLLVGLCMSACAGGKDDIGSDDTAGLVSDVDTETDPDIDADTDTDTDTDTDEPEPEPEPMITATVRGTVTVEAYIDGPDGREEVDEAAYFGGDFPFGAVFISATNDTGAGIAYVGSDAVLTPSFTGNTYEITVTMPADAEVGVYASLDVENNLIVETSDPIGVHPSS